MEADLKKEKVHLIGVCGMGMAGLAACLEEAGYSVSGSDKAYLPPMGDFLKKRSIKLFEGFSSENCDPATDIFVVGNAVSKDNPEVKAAEKMNKPLLSMPGALGEIFLKQRYSVVVCGTHGKTTTTAMLSYLLHNLGKDPGFLVGGILKNYDIPARLGRGDIFVVEGDEYGSAFFDRDAKFHHYAADAVLLTGIEFDHADRYKNEDEIKEQFDRLISSLPQGAPLVVCTDLPAAAALAEKFSFKKPVTYGISDSSHRLTDFEWSEGYSFFTLVRKGRRSVRFKIPLIGRHNMLNALGCALMLEALGIPLATTAEAFEGFKGVRRRQDLVFNDFGIKIYDDFAHHPTAVRETLMAFRNAFSNNRIWAIFEPRTNTSRRKFFQDAYLQALAGADRVVVADVYAKDKLSPEDRLDPEKLVGSLQNIGIDASFIPTADKIAESVGNDVRKGDVVILFSAGAFDSLAEKLSRKVREKFSPSR